MVAFREKVLDGGGGPEATEGLDEGLEGGKTVLEREKNCIGKRLEGRGRSTGGGEKDWRRGEWS